MTRGGQIVLKISVPHLREMRAESLTLELKAGIFIWNCFVLRVEGLGGECVLRIWRLRLCELRFWVVAEASWLVIWAIVDSALERWAASGMSVATVF